MTALTVQPADRLSDDQLAALFNRGYSDYYVPITLDAAAFRGLVTANDIDLAASRVGGRDGAPVAFAMLAMRGRRGWIGGVGVVPKRWASATGAGSTSGGASPPRSRRRPGRCLRRWRLRSPGASGSTRASIPGRSPGSAIWAPSSTGPTGSRPARCA